MAIIRSEQYVELYSELAGMMLEANNGDGIFSPSEILLVTDANGDERYTEAAQDRFNDYCEEVESVLLANNIVGEQYLSENNVDRNLRLLVKATISAAEYNVLQVALDHMIEHQEYDAAAIDETYSDEERDDICKRLQAAKKLKALFS
jgi:EAL domain-containing protein (putative c-di-GMP-specific phosphodiesterase class I)